MLVRLLIAILGFTLLASLKVRTEAQSQSLTSPPEIKKTVEAITGIWKGHMIANVPDAPPGSIDWTMDCKPVALNTGALCSNSGKAPFGELAESCLLAFDPGGKAVHYMCVTSMGEVHDHKGRWTDPKTINFEPLRAGMMGQQVTETLQWHFDDDRTLDKRSEVQLSDGRIMRFQFIGVRQ